MVDVSEKGDTLREALACGKVLMKPSTAAAIEKGGLSKGDVFSVARIAGIMAAKKTGDLIPLCHPLEITGIDVTFASDPVKGEVTIEARVKTVGKTGVEMEALTAAGVAALTVYDMCKSADRAMVISDIKLMRKSGGRSGLYIREEQKKTGRKRG